MKFLIVFALCIAAALAAPANDAEVLSSSFDNIGIDGYKFEYVASSKLCKSINANGRDPQGLDYCGDRLDSLTRASP